MAVAQAWDVKKEQHNNLVLFHTRTKDAQDWFADNTDAEVFGTAYVVEHWYAEAIIEALQAEGFVVR